MSLSIHAQLSQAIRWLLPLAESYLKDAPSHPDHAKLESVRGLLAAIGNSDDHSAVKNERMLTCVLCKTSEYESDCPYVLDNVDDEQYVVMGDQLRQMMDEHGIPEEGRGHLVQMLLKRLDSDEWTFCNDCVQEHMEQAGTTHVFHEWLKEQEVGGG